MLYQYNEMGAPFSDRDALIRDRLLSWGGGRESLLFGHSEEDERKAVVEGVTRDRAFVYCFYYVDETPIGCLQPLTRMIHGYSIDADVVGLPEFLTRSIISRNVSSALDERAAMFGWVEDEALSSAVKQSLEQVDVKLVLGKVFSGSVLYLVAASLFVVAMICASGLNNLAAAENASRWEVDGLWHVEVWVDGTAVVNCSGALFLAED